MDAKRTIGVTDPQKNFTRIVSAEGFDLSADDEAVCLMVA